jgi:regulator of RNase E activity RraA
LGSAQRKTLPRILHWICPAQVMIMRFHHRYPDMIMSQRKLTGKIARERVVMLDIPRPSKKTIEAFLALTDLAGTVSDAMDELGIAGAIPAAVLMPTLPGARMVGPALTIRNIMQSVPPTLGAMERKSKQADLEAHNLAQPGDVIVIEGVAGISSLGGNSAALGKRQGEAGAVVDGATRDVATARRLDYPIWARGVSLITGKWRLETVAINGPVQIGGVPVGPGDLVIADDNGVCFIPRDRIQEVLDRARALSSGEEARNRDVAAGLSISEVANKAYFTKLTTKKK